MADLDSGGKTDAAGEPASAAFEEAAARAARKRTGPVGEFAYFLRRTRKYWLVPVIVSLLLTALIAVGGGSVVAPLIY